MLKNFGMRTKFLLSMLLISCRTHLHQPFYLVRHRRTEANTPGKIFLPTLAQFGEHLPGTFKAANRELNSHSFRRAAGGPPQPCGR